MDQIKTYPMGVSCQVLLFLHRFILYSVINNLPKRETPMNPSQKNKAYYHLPGLFEFYELYRVFLPLFREHRE